MVNRTKVNRISVRSSVVLSRITRSCYTSQPLCVDWNLIHKQNRKVRSLQTLNFRIHVNISNKKRSLRGTEATVTVLMHRMLYVNLLLTEWNQSRIKISERKILFCEFYIGLYEGQSISNASYLFLLYFSRKLKYNYTAWKPQHWRFICHFSI